MKLKSLIEHSADLLQLFWKTSKSSEQITKEFFGNKKYIGSKERKIIAEITFATLRLWGFSSRICEEIGFDTKNNKPTIIVLISFLIITKFYPAILVKTYQLLFELNNDKINLSNANIEIIFEIVGYEKKFFWSIEDKIDGIIHYCNDLIEKNDFKEFSDSELDSLSIRYSIPKFIMNSWIRYYCERGLNPFDIAESLLFPAPFVVRVNTVEPTRNEIIKQLEKDGISAKPTQISPIGIVIEERVNILQHDLYRKGIIEIQDEGSQLICYAVDPRRNDKILDACAGAGGKSLLLAYLQGDKGKIVANDVDYLKLKELNRRAKRANFKSIETHYIRNEKQHKLIPNYFDKVLIDAPCSGIGTARRSPMQKWRLTPENLGKYQKKQLKLLDFYSRFLRVGGELIYSTCSLMPEENEDVVTQFLQENPNFEPVPLKPSFDKYYIEIPKLIEDVWFITLLPSLHKTDGFFIAKLKKTS